MAKPRAFWLALAALALVALLLAGCSGGFRAGDEDGGVTAGGQAEGDDDNDTPPASFGIVVATLGVVAFVRRRLA